MDFHALQGPYGSRLKFWTVPQGLRPSPDLARVFSLLESGPALRTVWTVAVWTPDPGETHQAKLGEAGTGFSHPKIQNPESGIRDSTW